MERMKKRLIVAIQKMEANLHKMKPAQEHPKEEMRAGRNLLKEYIEQAKNSLKKKNRPRCKPTKADDHRERIMATMDSQLEKTDVFEEMLKNTNTADLEANREKSEAAAVHREEPKEGAVVETMGALGDRYRGRHLAVVSRRQPKERTQGDGGRRQKLPADRGR
jgi:methyltransferase-like protein